MTSRDNNGIVADQMISTSDEKVNRRIPVLKKNRSRPDSALDSSLHEGSSKSKAEVSDANDHDQINHQYNELDIVENSSSML